MLWPLLLYFLLVVAVAVALLLLTYYMGERHHERATSDPYESGMIPTGTARIRFPAEFYLIAMFFVIFDLETIFIVAWAIGMQDMGWPGFISVSIFIVVLFAALGYLWREGALDWGTSRRKKNAALLKKGIRYHAEHR
jgi:NADH-quinone oxidoreductase subunit A